jgi:hypothetical protein
LTLKLWMMALCWFQTITAAKSTVSPINNGECLKLCDTQILI